MLTPPNVIIESEKHQFQFHRLLFYEASLYSWKISLNTKLQILVSSKCNKTVVSSDMYVLNCIKVLSSSQRKTSERKIRREYKASLKQVVEDDSTITGSRKVAGCIK